MARRGVMSAFVLGLLLAGFSVAGVSGQDADVFDPQKTTASPKPRSGKNTPRPATTPSGPVCYTITAAVEKTKPNGLLWDGPGDTDPDIMLTETTSGATVTCRSTFTCTLSVKLISSTAKLTLFDKDLKFHDDIGSGQCSVGNTCRVGSATVTMKRC